METEALEPPADIEFEAMREEEPIRGLGLLEESKPQVLEMIAAPTEKPKSIIQTLKIPKKNDDQEA